MQSRRDQVQAYFYLVGRMVSAVTHGRTDALVAPNRRASTGTVLGVLLAVLATAVCGIYGLVVPGGSTAWQAPGALIAVKETGARFLYLDGALRPVLNTASARLAGAGGGPVVPVATASLAGTPVGRPIGIPGAPDAVPPPTGLDAGAWSACVRPPEAASAATPTVALLLGRAPGRPLDGDQALLVATPDGARHLLWRGQRHRIADPATAGVLGYAATPPTPVTVPWIGTVPAGRDLGVPPTAGAGRAGPAVEGRPSRVGQVFAVHNPAVGADRLYLLRADGMAPVSPTVAALVLASPSTAPAYVGGPAVPIPVGPAALAASPVSRGTDLAGGLPATPPVAVVAPGDSVPCSRVDPGGATTIEVRSRAEVDAGAGPTAAHPLGTIADLVSVPLGGGALVREPGAAGPPALVTDAGVRFPLSDAAASQLGYANAPATVLPAPWLDLLPGGPVLDPPAALRDPGL